MQLQSADFLDHVPVIRKEDRTRVSCRHCDADLTPSGDPCYPESGSMVSPDKIDIGKLDG